MNRLIPAALMPRLLLSVILAAVFGIPSAAQTEPRYQEEILRQEILPPEVALFQLRQYILNRVSESKLSAPATAAEWTADSKRIREEILSGIVFHGWPKEWVESAPKFEDLGVVPGNGYQIRKLRYEIVPGFQSTAILYEPLNLHGKVPAILNVNGHVGALGKSVEYKQKRCITFARNGILALNLEWLSYGELSAEFNQHWYGAHLDLAGANELGLFYLAMRRGLDYLYEHPNTDRARVGMTGLSGGGWQTIILSSLDERVKEAAAIAGFSSIIPRVEATEFGDIGDIEQSATDLFNGRDYPWLAALRAPRPTLLAYNAEDDCCFRAAMVKPGVFDAIGPFFTLYGKREDFAWHENRDPGTHNYQLDNRKAAYEFFSHHFEIPLIEEDPGIGSEVKSYDELVVGLPADNLTIVGLARQFADQVKRDALPSEASSRDRERARLKEIVRYQAAKASRVWTTGVTKHGGIETKTHLFAMTDGLTTSGVWLRPIGALESAPATIILDDKGKAAASVAVTDRVNRGEQVLAADLPFYGDAWKDESTWLFEQMIDTTGARPLGIEAAHLVELAHWLKQQGAPRVRLETNGMRSQVAALVAAALEPNLFSEVAVQHGIASLRYLVDKPVPFHEAADLFCLDLYKFTDVDRLVVLGPSKTSSTGSR
jgi:dienelactone hydrolase